jgi:hypothetical protein
MATQVQWRGGSTAEHATFTGAAREITVDTQKQTLVVHDGSTVGGAPLQKQYPPLGSAAAPTYTFTGDTNTGIYSPGADQVAVATNGTGRLFIDASGRVGLGDSTPTVPLDITGSATEGLRIKSDNSATRGFELFNNSTSDLAYISNFYNGPIVFQTNNTERMRLTSTGLGIGTSTFSYLANKLVIDKGSTANDGITIVSSNTSNGCIWFADGTTGNEAYRGGIDYNHSTEKMQIYTGGLGNITIDSAGKIGVGTTSPDASDWNANSQVLHIYKNTTEGSILKVESSNAVGVFAAGNGIVAVGSTSNDPLQFRVNVNEVGQFDTSGRLLVGTSSTSGNIAGNDKLAVVITGNDTQGGISVTDYAGSSATLGSYAALRLQRSLGTTDGSFTALTASAWGLGRIEFNGSNGVGFGTGATIEGIADALAWGNGDHPARLVFSTTADGASTPTERMRISNNGTVLISCTSFPSATVKGVGWANNSGVGYYYSSAVSITGSSEHAQFVNPNGVVGTITTSGSATAYNTSSDYRLKENVTPVTDGITRLQQLKPSRFNFIADPGHTVDGFIAHEAQAVVPECVTGTKDAVDAEGNPIYQGIDQSKLVPLLTAALQEAIGEIESLKARLTAAGL